VTLPLALRNRLADLILEAFDDEEARCTLDALGAFCRSAGVRVRPAMESRLTALGWFQTTETGGLRLLGAHEAHRDALCRRTEAALALFQDGAALPQGRTQAGLLARAALLADRGLFFEVHELLEPAWMRAAGAERVALQALIQVAVAFHHAENGNRQGAISLLTEGLAKLAAAGSPLPLDTLSWKPALVTILIALQEGRPLPPAPPWPHPRGGSPTEAAWRFS